MAQRYAVESGDETKTKDGRTCPECRGCVRTLNHETACTDCGLIIDEETIDHGPEWRSFEPQEDSRSRVGAPRTVARHDKGLSTDFFTTRDGHGKTLSGKRQRQLRRLRTQHSRAKFNSKKERNQCFVFNEIRRISSALGMANLVRNRACDLFRTAHKEQVTKGRSSLEGFGAACVYATCRCLGLPWKLEDFESVARCPPNQTKVAYNAMNQHLPIPTKPVLPRKFVPRYADALGLSDSTRRRAESFVEYYEAEGLHSGREAAGVAAGALYMAARENDERFPQAQAADVAGCTPNTIRGRFSEFLQIRNHI